MVRSKGKTISLLSSSDEESGPPTKKRPAQPVQKGRLAKGIGKQLVLQPSHASEQRSALEFTSSQPSQHEPQAATRALTGPEIKIAESSVPSAVDNELWTSKYAPRAREDLVVHKDKVVAVASWLDSQIASDAATSSSACLLITGPAGSGKSTVVDVLARGAELDIIEWHPPLPTLWHEHRYQEGLTVPYVSKLDDFDSFVAHAKMNALQLGPSAATEDAGSQNMAHGGTMECQLPSPSAGQRRSVVVVDDLPHAQGPAQRKRLVQALGTLAATAKQPVIIIMTETGSSGSSKERMPAGGGTSNAAASTTFSLSVAIKAAVTASGATHIQFNALADTFATKALLAVAEKEGLSLSKEAAKQCAVQAAGDLFHAIETLQLACAGKPRRCPSAPRKRGRGKGSKKALQEQLGVGDLMGSSSRDVTLSMFRALGKILYNKRMAPQDDPASAAGSADEPSWPADMQTGLQALLGNVESGRRLSLADRLQRPPSEYIPEGIMLHSGLEVGLVAAFLHENMLHFFADGAIEDVAAAYDYIGDADRLLGGQTASSSSAWDADDHPSSSFGEAAAGSVLARGLMWSNNHPAPRSWYQMRSPAWRAAQRAQLANVDALGMFVWQHGVGGSVAEWVAGTLPFLRCMASWDPSHDATHLLPAHWWRMWNGQLIEEHAEMPAATAAHSSPDPGSMADGEAGEEGIED